MTTSLTARLAITLAATGLLLLMPVAPHDWGDDFALYIMQAAGMAGDGSPADLFVPGPDAAFSYSPARYPPGFPALLAPVYVVTGPDLRAFQIYMSVLLAVAGLAIYGYARRKLHDPFVAVAIALVIVFHASTLDLKQSILSDIPFVLFTTWFLDRVEEGSNLLLPIALAIAAWLVRSAGIVIVVAWGLDAAMRAIMRTDDAKRTRAYLMAAIGAAGAIAVLWLLVNDTQGYAGGLKTWAPFSRAREVFAADRALFEQYVGGLSGWTIRYVVAAGLAVLLLVGAWASYVRDRRSIGLWFCACYSGMLLSYPYQHGGYRLILPLLPVCWTYVGRGWLELAARVPSRPWLRSALPVVLLLLTCRQVYIFSTHRTDPQFPPGSPAAVELFEAMQQMIPSDSLTLSARPRALALFAHRAGTTVSAGASDAAVEQLIADRGVRFVICGAPLRNDALTRYCEAHQTAILFRNDAFAIYKTGP